MGTWRTVGPSRCTMLVGMAECRAVSDIAKNSPSQRLLRRPPRPARCSVPGAPCSYEHDVKPGRSNDTVLRSLTNNLVSHLGLVVRSPGSVRQS